jgi:hypothetical protein
VVTLEVLYCGDQPCNQAQREATWTGCGPESAHGSCYGKPLPASATPAPPQKDKCMGMGCNPDTWTPTPVTTFKGGGPTD